MTFFNPTPTPSPATRLQAAAELEAKKRSLQGECGDVADDVEVDADREIEDVRARFEAKLLVEGRVSVCVRLETHFYDENLHTARYLCL